MILGEIKKRIRFQDIFRIIPTLNLSILVMLICLKFWGVRYDTLYFFSGITPPEIIAEKIHLPYNNSWLRDDQYRLILVRDDEVVYDIDMRRNHCNWHLPEDEAITEHIFMVVKPYDRYELIPKK